MASTTEIEIGNQIRFWGQLVGTDGLDDDINVTANEYVRRLTKAMKPFVDDYIEEADELVKEREADKERVGKMIMEPTEGDFANLKIIKE